MLSLRLPRRTTPRWLPRLQPRCRMPGLFLGLSRRPLTSRTGEAGISRIAANDIIEDLRASAPSAERSTLARAGSRLPALLAVCLRCSTNERRNSHARNREKAKHGEYHRTIHTDASATNSNTKHSSQTAADAPSIGYQSTRFRSGSVRTEIETPKVRARLSAVFDAFQLKRHLHRDRDIIDAAAAGGCVVKAPRRDLPCVVLPALPGQVLREVANVDSCRNSLPSSEGAACSCCAGQVAPPQTRQCLLPCHIYPNRSHPWMLDRGALPAARGTAGALPELIARRVCAPPDHEWHKSRGRAVLAPLAPQPDPSRRVL